MGTDITTYIDVDGIGGYYAEWNKSITERPLSFGFTHMWNIRNSAEDHRGREGNWMGSYQRRRKTMRDS